MLAVPMACRQGELPDPSGRRVDPGALSHGMIELGEQLEDPYSVENMREALAALYPTRAGEIPVSTTDLYVRFLPADEEQYARLLALDLRLMDHPVDYRIVREGDYYHDPEISEDAITWQYAVVPRNFTFPSGIRYEILDECFISEHDPVTRADTGIDWDAVEREAYVRTGNAGLFPETRDGEEGSPSGPVFPSGRITVEDPDAFGGKPYGLAGVMVCCNSFVKFATAYTDRDGYYQLPKKYSTTPRYRLVFKNSAGFSIGLNLILVPASVSTLGKGPASGIDAHIDASSDGALFRRAAVNNAAYDYIARCAASDLDIKEPPKDLRIWIFKDLKCSSSAMLHHGAFVESNDLIQRYLGGYVSLLKVFLPDITIGAGGGDAAFVDLVEPVHHLHPPFLCNRGAGGLRERYGRGCRLLRDRGDVGLLHGKRPVSGPIRRRPSDVRDLVLVLSADLPIPLRAGHDLRPGLPGPQVGRHFTGRPPGRPCRTLS